jgi:hypothetical protein
MIDDLDELERELKQLRPRRAGAALLGRVAAGLEQPEAAVWDRGVRWALPAAAGLVLGIVAVRFAEPPGADRDVGPAARHPVGYAARESLPPVAAEKFLLEAEDDGLLTLADGTAVRRIRSRSVDTVTWRDPYTNASLQWSVPRERIRLLPVVAQ